MPCQADQNSYVHSSCATLSEDYRSDHGRVDILTYCRKLNVRTKSEVCDSCSAASLKHVECCQSPQAVKPTGVLSAKEMESYFDE